MKRKREEQIMQIEFFKYASLMEKYEGYGESNPYKYMFHSPNGGLRDVITATMFKKMGVKPGIPDVICILPIIDTLSYPYNGVCIEFKSINGALTHNQLEWINKFRKCKYLCHVCRSSKEAINMFNSYYGLNPEK